MIRRSREPALWALFSAGGMLAALVLPIVAALFWIARPLGWVSLQEDQLAGTLLHPIGRVFLFALVMLSLFHWAHRFRYTLYDGLQLYHLHHLIAIVTYGFATAATLVAALVLLVAL